MLTLYWNINSETKQLRVMMRLKHTLSYTSIHYVLPSLRIFIPQAWPYYLFPSWRLSGKALRDSRGSCRIPNPNPNPDPKSVLETLSHCSRPVAPTWRTVKVDDGVESLHSSKLIWTLVGNLCQFVGMFTSNTSEELWLCVFLLALACLNRWTPCWLELGVTK